MSQRLERILKGLILISLALFLTSSIVNGTLLFYINRRFAWLTWIATLLLLFIAFAYQRPCDTKHRRDSEENSKGQHEHNNLDHSENVWIRLALVALPLLLGILVPPRPLGAQAVGGREVNANGIGLGNDETVLTQLAAQRNILDWLRAFNGAGDTLQFDGQEGMVTGFVYRDDSFPDDEFMVSRFVISCCVADATAVGLIVAWPQSLELPPDSWVEVHGTFQADGRSVPVLRADSVTPARQPNQPYLYP